jgi:hypothetical protein
METDAVFDDLVEKPRRHIVVQRSHKRLRRLPLSLTLPEFSSRVYIITLPLY